LRDPARTIWFKARDAVPFRGASPMTRASLHDLVAALERASAACMSPRPQRIEAVFAAMGVLSSVYLHFSGSSREVAREIERIYDACIVALGDACAGDHARLEMALATVRAYAASARKAA